MPPSTWLPVQNTFLHFPPSSSLASLFYSRDHDEGAIRREDAGPAWPVPDYHLDPLAFLISPKSQALDLLAGRPVFPSWSTSRDTELCLAQDFSKQFLKIQLHALPSISVKHLRAYSGDRSKHGKGGLQSTTTKQSRKPIWRQQAHGGRGVESLGNVLVPPQSSAARGPERWVDSVPLTNHSATESGIAAEISSCVGYSRLPSPFLEPLAPAVVGVHDASPLSAPNPPHRVAAFYARAAPDSPKPLTVETAAPFLRGLPSSLSRSTQYFGSRPAGCSESPAAANASGGVVHDDTEPVADAEQTHSPDDVVVEGGISTAVQSSPRRPPALRANAAPFHPASIPMPAAYSTATNRLINSGGYSFFRCSAGASLSYFTSSRNPNVWSPAFPMAWVPLPAKSSADGVAIDHPPLFRLPPPPVRQLIDSRSEGDPDLSTSSSSRRDSSSPGSRGGLPGSGRSNASDTWEATATRYRRHRRRRHHRPKRQRWDGCPARSHPPLVIGDTAAKDHSHLQLKQSQQHLPSVEQPDRCFSSVQSAVALMTSHHGEQQSLRNPGFWPSSTPATHYYIPQHQLSSGWTHHHRQASSQQQQPSTLVSASDSSFLPPNPPTSLPVCVCSPAPQSVGAGCSQGLAPSSASFAKAVAGHQVSPLRPFPRIEAVEATYAYPSPFIINPNYPSYEAMPFLIHRHVFSGQLRRRAGRKSHAQMTRDQRNWREGSVVGRKCPYSGESFRGFGGRTRGHGRRMRRLVSREHDIDTGEAKPTFGGRFGERSKIDENHAAYSNLRSGEAPMLAAGASSGTMPLRHGPLEFDEDGNYAGARRTVAELRCHWGRLPAREATSHPAVSYRQDSTTNGKNPLFTGHETQAIGTRRRGLFSATQAAADSCLPSESKDSASKGVISNRVAYPHPFIPGLVLLEGNQSLGSSATAREGTPGASPPFETGKTSKDRQKAAKKGKQRVVEEFAIVEPKSTYEEAKIVTPKFAPTKSPPISLDSRKPVGKNGRIQTESERSRRRVASPHPATTALMVFAAAADESKDKSPSELRVRSLARGDRKEKDGGREAGREAVQAEKNETISRIAIGKCRQRNHDDDYRPRRSPPSKYSDPHGQSVDILTKEKEAKGAFLQASPNSAEPRSAKRQLENKKDEQMLASVGCGMKTDGDKRSKPETACSQGSRSGNQAAQIATRSVPVDPQAVTSKRHVSEEMISNLSVERSPSGRRTTRPFHNHKGRKTHGQSSRSLPAREEGTSEGSPPNNDVISETIQIALVPSSAGDRDKNRDSQIGKESRVASKKRKRQKPSISTESTRGGNARRQVSPDRQHSEESSGSLQARNTYSESRRAAMSLTEQEMQTGRARIVFLSPSAADETDEAFIGVCPSTRRNLRMSGSDGQLVSSADQGQTKGAPTSRPRPRRPSAVVYESPTGPPSIHTEESN